MSWLIGRTPNVQTRPDASGHKGFSKALLSEGLQRLDAGPLWEQVWWWTERARGLDPSRLQLDSNEVDFDILGRFFDGTTLGVNFIINRVVGVKDQLNIEDLHQLLVGHFGFVANREKEAVIRDPSFIEFCDVILGGDGSESSGNRTATRDSLIYAIRRLRLGALLVMPRQLQDRLYHYSYSGETITGSFVPSSTTEPRFGKRGWYKVAVVERQKTCGECGSTAEYVFSDQGLWEGHTHWVHAHEPELRILLALGQQHQLRSHIQGLLCRLQGASPQLDISEAKSLDDTATANQGPCWSALVFPSFHLDGAACRSLQRYRAWLAQKSAEAKLGKTSGTLVPPCVSVGVVHQNLAVLWTGAEERTVISVSTEAAYLGRWNSAEPRHTKSMASLLARCWCCHRWKGDSAYQQLPQDDYEDGPEVHDMPSEDSCEDLMSDTVERTIRELETSALAERSATFELSFRDVLAQLGEANSMLRMGGHVQLAFRIMLNGTSHILDVMCLYTAAICRIKCLLSEKEHPQKESLIAKVSEAKLELSTLQRMVEPFMEHVMPQLRTEVLPTSATNVDDALPSRVALHHMVDMENNLREFLRECRSQIQLCESLINEYHLKASDKVNNILNFLTIITFIIMPVQLLTGLYGMNFKRMPELEWEYGYIYFFGLAVTATALGVLCLIWLYRTMV